MSRIQPRESCRSFLNTRVYAVYILSLYILSISSCQCHLDDQVGSLSAKRISNCLHRTKRFSTTGWPLINAPHITITGHEVAPANPNGTITTPDQINAIPSRKTPRPTADNRRLRIPPRRVSPALCPSCEGSCSSSATASTVIHSFWPHFLHFFLSTCI